MKLRLLIVEDDAVLAHGLKTNFECEGFDVLVVRDRIAAPRSIPTFTADVILLDNTLAEVAGSAVLALSRERGVAIRLLVSPKAEPEDVGGDST